jgi:hypothetical protein
LPTAELEILRRAFAEAESYKKPIPLSPDIPELVTDNPENFKRVDANKPIPEPA